MKDPENRQNQVTWSDRILRYIHVRNVDGPCGGRVRRTYWPGEAPDWWCEDCGEDVTEEVLAWTN